MPRAAVHLFCLSLFWVWSMHSYGVTAFADRKVPRKEAETAPDPKLSNQGLNGETPSSGGSPLDPLGTNSTDADLESAKPGKAEPRYWEALTQWNDLFFPEWSLGMHVGEPTGLAGRIFLSDLKAVSVQTGWSFRGLKGFHFSSDLLLYLFDPIGVKKFELDGYVGPGVFFKLWQTERVTINSDSELVRQRDQNGSFGLRVPFGLSLYFLRPALEFYAEITPAMSLFPATEFNIDFGAGLLFRFAKPRKVQMPPSVNSKAEKSQEARK